MKTSSSPERSLPKRILGATAAAAIGILSVGGCAATARSHSRALTSGTAMNEIEAMYPNSYDLESHEAKGNPNYISWRATVDGKREFCTAYATAVQHIEDNPHSIVGPVGCAPDVGQ